MTRWLHLDPIGGIAGDMTLAALIDLGARKEAIEAGLATLDLEPFEIVVRAVEVNALRARQVEVRLPEASPSRDFAAIRGLLERAALPARVRDRALSTFTALAEAEARAHGCSIDAVHFHEVGAVDALVDIVGTALALEDLGVEGVSAGPPPLGRGVVRAAHGPLPVPAPATLRLLEGLPCTGTETEGELTTPTGAALLRALSGGEVGALPALRVLGTGYGAGHARWADRPNLLRVVLGKRLEAPSPRVWRLETNLDDLTPELVALAAEALLEAGALDAWVTPVIMKRGRPGHLLSALCRDEARPAVTEAMLRQSSTFGVRASPAERTELERTFEEVATPYGPVRLKVGRLGREVLTRTPELTSCEAAARAAGVPVRVVYAAAAAASVAAGDRAGAGDEGRGDETPRVP